MSSYLVTGGAGFIGSHLITRFVDDGHDVRVLDNLSTGKESNLAHVAARIEFIRGDLRDPDDCRRACADVEVVFHQAAIPSVPRSVADPRTSHDANVNGTFNLLMAARQQRCRRVVYASSSSAYGQTEVSPKHEGLCPQPMSPYAVHKLAGEHYCRAFYECFGLETISLRYFNVFGARQDPTSQYAAAIPAFVTAILRDEPPTVFGDGQQTRDFTYVDNVVHANLLAASVRRTAGEAVNVGCGEEVSVNQVIRSINALLGKDVRCVYTAPRAGDVRHSLADLALAKRVLGYEPIVRFEDGLARSIEWYAGNGSEKTKEGGGG